MSGGGMHFSTREIWRSVAAAWMLFPACSVLASPSAPPSFDVEGTRAVYIDISSAHYEITFDVAAKTAAVRATINFSTTEQGAPLFDSAHEPTSIRLDGKSVGNTLVASPDSVTQYRMLARTLRPGLHRMVVEAPLSTGVAFDETGFRAAFFMSDADDRSFLEKYLPANLEFDQYSMTFLITIANAANNLAQDVFTNGAVTKLAENKWRIQFPDYYTTSSPYFHTAPVGVYEKLETSVISISGKEIPILIYGKADSIAAGSLDLNTFLSEVSPWFEWAEAHYGPWLHSGLVIYAIEDGGDEFDYLGMEYCGATATELGALTHELAHSYFGRGVMPMNGDSGWLDEGAAVWSDYSYYNGYAYTYSINTAYSSMGNRSFYYRTFDFDGYSEGRRLLRYLAYLAELKNGKEDFFNFMRDFAQNQKFDPLSSQDFQSQVEAYLGTDLQFDFDQAVYGVYGEGDTNYKSSSKQKEQSRFHKSLTPEQLRELL
jgi:hypothetical protein